MAIERSALEADRIIVIPNAVDAADSVDRDRLPGPWRVGFVGRLDPIKRVPDLVAAVAAIPDVELHVYGDGPERQSIGAAISRAGIQSRAALHGTVASANVALRTIDTLVLPSDAEGFGLVLIEAMAAGVPVIGTDVPGIRDVIQNGVTGLLVPPRDPRRLASAIDRSRHDHCLRQSLIAAAHDEVRRAYAWAAVLEQYAAVLRGMRR